MVKIPSQGAGALTGFSTGIMNQGIQAVQTVGNQLINQVGQNLAQGRPLLGNGQPMVVQGLGQDPNTYVIGGSDFYPGGNAKGQTQQWEQGSVPELVTGQLVPTSSQRNMYGGGTVGTGGQYVSESTQPEGVIDPSTGEQSRILSCRRFREF
jgi:hypothetical protein